MLESYVCCCTSDKELDGEYEDVRLRHEDVVAYLKFITTNRDLRISTDEYMRYAFKPWDEMTKRDKYDFLEMWRKIPTEEQDKLRQQHESKLQKLTANIANFSNDQTIQFNKVLSNKTIDETFDYNRFADLRRFIEKRESLIAYNNVMVYMFHLSQTLGIMITSISAGTNQPGFIWLGILFNALATLISLWEKTNSQIMKKLMEDIKLIREGRYVDEGSLVEIEDSTKKDDKGKKADKGVEEADQPQQHQSDEAGVREEKKEGDEDVESTNTDSTPLLQRGKGSKSYGSK